MLKFQGAFLQWFILIFFCKLNQNFYSVRFYISYPPKKVQTNLKKKNQVPIIRSTSPVARSKYEGMECGLWNNGALGGVMLSGSNSMSQRS